MTVKVSLVCTLANSWIPTKFAHKTAIVDTSVVTLTYSSRWHQHFYWLITKWQLLYWIERSIKPLSKRASPKGVWMCGGIDISYLQKHWLITIFKRSLNHYLCFCLQKGKDRHKNSVIWRTGKTIYSLDIIIWRFDNFKFITDRLQSRWAISKSKRYDHYISQSHTADQSTAPRGRITEH